MIPIQTRILREQRELSQGQLAERVKTTQSVISRLEDPNYGKLSLSSLLKLASAYDVALLVKFVPFSRLLHEFEDASPHALSAKEFTEELSALEAWADGTHETNTAHLDAMKPILRLTSGAAEHYQMKLPLNFRSPELDFPLPGPVIVRDEKRGRSLSMYEPLREAS